MADITFNNPSTLIHIYSDQVGKFVCFPMPSLRIKVISNSSLVLGATRIIQPTILKIIPAQPIRRYSNLYSHSINMKYDEVDEVYYSGIDKVNGLLELFPEETQKFLGLTDDNVPKWNSFQWRWEDGTEAIQTAQKAMNKIKKLLQAAKGIISKVRSILNVIKRFLDFYEDTFRSFMRLLADQLQRLVDDMKATGFYFLDMTTYHFIEYGEEDVEPLSYSGPWWNTEVIQDDDVIKKREDIIDSLKNTKKSDFQFHALMNKLFTYKKETYEEFIDRICFHFTNPADTLPRQVQFQNNRASLQKMNLEGTVEDDKLSWKYVQTAFKERYKNAGWDQTKTIFGVFSGNGGLKSFRTGRPDFGPNGRMKVIILAWALPDVSKILEFMWLICGARRRPDGTWDFSKFGSGALGKIANGFMDIGREMGKAYNNAIEDISKNGYTNLFDLQTHFSPLKDNTATYPYWIGLTAGNVFGFIFDHIDNLIQLLRNMSFTVSRSPLDAIDGILRKIEAELDNLIELVDLINQILDFINMLLNIPTMAILNLDVTSGGTPKAVDMIRKSVGFFENAIDDARDIQDIGKKMMYNLAQQKTQDIYFNSFSSSGNTSSIGASNITAKNIINNYELWNNRYNVISYIYNYAVNKGLDSLYDQIYNNYELFEDAKNKRDEYVALKAYLISIGAPNSQIIEAQEQIDYYGGINGDMGLMQEYRDIIQIKQEQWNNHFNYITNYTNNFIYPVNDYTKIKIKTTDEVNNIDGWDQIKKDEENDKIEYNNMIQMYILIGKDALYTSKKSKLFNMLDYLNVEAKKIYDPKNENSILPLYRKYFDKNIEDANKYIEKELNDNKDLLESRLDSQRLYDPSNKYMFAGFVFVVGYPDLTRSYFDFSDFNKQVALENNNLNEEMGESIDGVVDSWKMLTKIFK